MKIRHTRPCSLDDIVTTELRGAVLHPELYEAMRGMLIEMANKDRISLLPSTLLEFYSFSMKRKITQLSERCHTKTSMLSS